MAEGSAPTTGRSRARATVLATILVADALFVAGAWHTLQEGRRAQYAEARRTMRNLAEVLGENLEGTVQLVDFALSEAKYELERELARGGTDAEIVEPLLLRLYTQLPFVAAIRTASADGKVVHGIGLRGGASVDVSDRDYFRRAQQLPGVDMVFSEPLVSRITGKRSLAFARRLDGPDGRFAGVVYAVVELEQFTRTLGRVKVGRLGTVALRTGDLSLVARFPAGPETAAAIGQRKVSPTLQTALDAGHEEGEFTTDSPVDGLEKVTAYRRVAGRNFVVLVATASDDFLADWRVRARITWGASALFVLLSALGGWLILRALRQEQERRDRVALEEARARTAAERERLIVELQKALAEVKTLGGLLPICAHCKKVRDDKGYWNRIENYIRERSNAQFTHGICPDCERQFYGDEGAEGEGEPPDGPPGKGGAP